MGRDAPASQCRVAFQVLPDGMILGRISAIDQERPPLPGFHVPGAGKNAPAEFECLD